MEMRVLVTYASKYGSTAEIADKIGEVLRASGNQVNILPVKRVDDLAVYDAVVLGSAVYIGKWRKSAAKFLKKNEAILVQRPVWLFSSGPTGDGDPVELLEGWRFPKKQQPIAERIQPRDIVVFHGNVDVDVLNGIEKSMVTNVKVPVGDFRDWDTITTWAECIAEALE